jgi:DNA polymerase-3 subunit delta
LAGDPARLADEAAAFSMFGEARWIRVTGASDDLLPSVAALLQAEQAGNPVVLLAGALKPTSKLLKLCLDSRAAMALASYMPEGRNAEQIAIGIARDLGLRLNPDLARGIVGLSGGDRALMAGEIEKLALYLDVSPEQPGEATAEALGALSAETLEQDLGALVNAVMGGDVSALSHELATLAALNVSLAGALRVLIGRAMLIAQIRAAFERGGRVEAAMDSAGRAVFWKERDVVQRQVRRWDSKGIARVLTRLSAAERASRSSGNAGEVLVAQELLAITRQAAREKAG